MGLPHEIINQIANDRIVEQQVEKVCGRPAAQLPDLVQTVYEILINYKRRIYLFEDRGIDGLSSFVGQIVKKQYYSNSSRYYRDIRRFSRRSTQIDDETINAYKR